MSEDSGDAMGLRRRPHAIQRSNGKSSFSHVDDRISFPLSNGSFTGRTSDQQLLQTGISKYRDLQSRASASDIDPASDYATQADDLVQNKKYAQAIPLLTALIKQAQSSSKSGNAASALVSTFSKRGYCMLQTKRAPEAIDDFSCVLRHIPRSADVLAFRAQAYAQNNDLEKAVADYASAVELIQEEGVEGVQLRNLLVEKAKLEYRLNYLGNALDTLKNVPNGEEDVEVRQERAQIYSRTQQGELAAMELEKVLELLKEERMMAYVDGSDHALESRLIETHLLHADLVLEVAREKEAGFCDYQGLESGQRREQSRILESPEARELVHAAVEDYAQVLRFDESHVVALRKRGEAYAFLGKVEQALQDFDACRKADPREVEVALSRAKLFRSLQQREAAIQELTQVLATNGFFIEALLLRASLYEEEGDLDSARKDYTCVVQAQYPLDKEDEDSKVLGEMAAEALVRRARVERKRHRYEEALGDYARVLKAFPNNLEAQLEPHDARQEQREWEKKQNEEAIQWILNKEEEEKEQRKKSKKKKKGKKKKRRPDSSNYVLLDEEKDTVTRDEAFESVLWENAEDEEPLKEEENAPVETNGSETSWEETASTSNPEDDTNGDASKASEQANVSPVIIDEKYLKKRQKQLESIRSKLSSAIETRNKEEVRTLLERIERKAMSSALEEEVKQAKDMLEENGFVSKPIAYGQALALAGQTQSQMEEKDEVIKQQKEEIEDLKQEIRRLRGEGGDQEEVEHLVQQFPMEQMREETEGLVEWLAPTSESDRVRNLVIGFIHQTLTNVGMMGPCLVFPMGSFPMKTYLPNGDLDLCLLVPPEFQPTWFLNVFHALAVANGTGKIQKAGSSPSSGKDSSTGFTVRNVSLINADVKVVKCTVDNLSVDITVNRVAAFGALFLLEEMDRRVGRDHLLKRSIVLIKAWCSHETSKILATSIPDASGDTDGKPPLQNTSVLGASQGGLSTYALNTIVMAVFNRYGTQIQTPLQALLLFLDAASTFRWQDQAMSIFGPVPVASVSYTQSDPESSDKYGSFLTKEDLAPIQRKVRAQFGTWEPNSTSGGVFLPRNMNVLDPLERTNNLTRSVSPDFFPHVLHVFKTGRKQLATLLAHKGSLRDFCPVSYQLYARGDGWRPDLLVHPRQVWTPVPKDKKRSDYDQERWQAFGPDKYGGLQSPMNLSNGGYGR